MVTSISSLMRASISNKRSMVYIREEIKYVQDYLYIQETRYGDKFTSYIEVDERLNELEIPKMTIQTLVENAVIHGVENATISFSHFIMYHFGKFCFIYCFVHRLFLLAFVL